MTSRGEERWLQLQALCNTVFEKLHHCLRNHFMRQSTVINPRFEVIVCYVHFCNIIKFTALHSDIRRFMNQQDYHFEYITFSYLSCKTAVTCAPFLEQCVRC